MRLPSKPRADARPRLPEDLHARLVQVAVGVVGGYGIGNLLEPGDRIQEASEMSSTGAPFHMRSLQQAWRASQPCVIGVAGSLAVRQPRTVELALIDFPVDL